jgi:hypothetical protein
VRQVERLRLPAAAKKEHAERDETGGEEKRAEETHHAEQGQEVRSWIVAP